MGAVSTADAYWEGDLPSGSGAVRPASGAFAELPVSWATRTARAEAKTSPEELIAAAHSACFSMAFSNGLSKAGHTVERVSTRAEVEFVPGTGITRSTLTVRGRVPGISEDEFRALAEDAKENCPVSKALHGNLEMTVTAELES